jgi:hypothetical protein
MFLDRGAHHPLRSDTKVHHYKNFFLLSLPGKSLALLQSSILFRFPLQVVGYQLYEEGGVDHLITWNHNEPLLTTWELTNPPKQVAQLRGESRIFAIYILPKCHKGLYAISHDVGNTIGIWNLSHEARQIGTLSSECPEKEDLWKHYFISQGTPYWINTLDHAIEIWNLTTCRRVSGLQANYLDVFPARVNTNTTHLFILTPSHLTIWNPLERSQQWDIAHPNLNPKLFELSIQIGDELAALIATRHDITAVSIKSGHILRTFNYENKAAIPKEHYKAAFLTPIHKEQLLVEIRPITDTDLLPTLFFIWNLGVTEGQIDGLPGKWSNVTKKTGQPRLLGSTNEGEHDCLTLIDPCPTEKVVVWESNLHVNGDSIQICKIAERPHILAGSEDTSSVYILDLQTGTHLRTLATENSEAIDRTEILSMGRISCLFGHTKRFYYLWNLNTGDLLGRIIPYSTINRDFISTSRHLVKKSTLLISKTGAPYLHLQSLWIKKSFLILPVGIPTLSNSEQEAWGIVHEATSTTTASSSTGQ